MTCSTFDSETMDKLLLHINIKGNCAYMMAKEHDCTNFFILKPTRCTNFTNLSRHETLHVSDSSSVHHQEFIYCTLSNGICHRGLWTAFEQDQDGTSWSCSEAVKLVHLVGFIIKVKYTYSRSQIRCTSVPIVWYGNYLTCLSLRNETIHLTKGRMVTVWGTPPYETPKIPAVCTSTPYRVTVGLQVRGTDSAPICRTVRGQSKE